MLRCRLHIEDAAKQIESNDEGSSINLIIKFLVSSEDVIYRNCENESHRARGELNWN